MVLLFVGMGSSFLSEVVYTWILRAVLPIAVSVMVELVSGLAQRKSRAAGIAAAI
jgi:hypothetical protein